MALKKEHPGTLTSKTTRKGDPPISWSKFYKLQERSLFAYPGHRNESGRELMD
jgi:hypothetical protein